MDFMLSKQHEMARTLFKEFAEKEVKPLAQEVDETEAATPLHMLCAWKNSPRYAAPQALSFPLTHLFAATRL